MEFIIAMLFGAFVSTSYQVTKVQPDCKKLEYKPEACKMAEKYEKLGK